MSKSVYSVVLMDDVVDAVDRLAYEAGTNRSNMINRILAEYVQLATPEQRMQDILVILLVLRIQLRLLLSQRRLLDLVQ